MWMSVDVPKPTAVLRAVKEALDHIVDVHFKLLTICIYKWIEEPQFLLKHA